MRPCLFFIIGLFLCCCENIPPPLPVDPVPSSRQLAWHDLEYYAFVHFNMNTFSNMEWGYGDESPAQFHPTRLDCRQWAQVCKDAGMKGIIITAKHHDGFSLWPSAYTEHSVKNSPWKDGKGDVLKDLSEACREYGLKFGIYLSPWDRNHPDYGRPEYVTYFRNQLRECLTNYGEVFEVWFDGANGGTGYYGGANENRKVDKRTYYDWPNTFAIIRELQPNAVIFGDAGLDVRWVGNEHGHAYSTTWSMLMRDSVYAGMPEYAAKYSSGQENGTHWVPAEADVSIRPGWYYHPYEDHKVKSLPQLLDIYYRSIGQNSSLLLNFPVDNRGLIHENDIAQLQKLTAKLQEDFAHDLAKGQRVAASNERGKRFRATHVVDGKKDTYWASADDVLTASITIEFERPTRFNRLLLQEYIALGQRVKAFTVETKVNGEWTTLDSATTIGYKRILRLPDITASTVRVNITDARACPVISNVEIYYAPKLVVPPTISRNKNGEVTLAVPEEGLEVYYTLDGSVPTARSTRYTAPFIQHTPATVQAIAVHGANQSEVSRTDLDVSAKKWVILHPDEKAGQLIDGLPGTWWAPAKDDPQNLVIDLGESLPLTGFTYLPMQGRWISGFVKEYAFYVSTNRSDWQLVSEGEFGNILNSPVEQRVSFPKTKARYVKCNSVSTVDGQPPAFAEVSILTR